MKVRDETYFMLVEKQRLLREKVGYQPSFDEVICQMADVPCDKIVGLVRKPKPEVAFPLFHAPTFVFARK